MGRRTPARRRIPARSLTFLPGYLLAPTPVRQPDHRAQPIDEVVVTIRCPLRCQLPPVVARVGDGVRRDGPYDVETLLAEIENATANAP